MTKKDTGQFEREKFLSGIKGVVKGLEEYNWTIPQACGNLLLWIKGTGYLTKIEEHYVVKMEDLE